MRGTTGAHLTVHDANDAKRVYHRAGFERVATGLAYDLRLER